MKASAPKPRVATLPSSTIGVHSMSITHPRRKRAPHPNVGLTSASIARDATEAFDELCASFVKGGAPVDFDFREHCLRWTSRGDHLTHRLHRYPARLTPYIPLFFLGVESVAVEGGRLLDPFAGCGTVLVEAPVHPVHAMKPTGFEINPLARLIAKVKTTSLDRRAVLDAWDRIVGRHDDDRSRVGLPRFPNKRHWFTSVVEARLARVLRAMEGLRDPDLRDFFLVAASAVVRQVSLADPGVAVPVRLDPLRFTDESVRRRARASLNARKHADVLALLDHAVRSNLQRLRAWAEVARVQSDAPAIVGADARTFKTAPYLGEGRLATRTTGTLSGVDLVLTSPPYANAQRYTRSLRLEQFVLGFTETGKDEGALDRLQVGTERVPFSDWDAMAAATSSATANDAIKLVRERDKFRAAIVGRYVRDMTKVIDNCYAALKCGGHAVFVIGNNCVRGVQLDNALIFSELGERAGFSPRLHVRNRIPSRGLLTKRHPTAGVITHEHVVVLRKPVRPPSGKDLSTRKEHDHVQRRD